MNTICSMFSYGIVVVATPRVRIDRYMTPLLPLPPPSTLYRHSQTFVLFQGRWRTDRRNYDLSHILFSENVTLPLDTGSVNNVLPLACATLFCLEEHSSVADPYVWIYLHIPYINFYLSSITKQGLRFSYTPHLKGNEKYSCRHSSTRP
jgi:hypothetical protein